MRPAHGRDWTALDVLTLNRGDHTKTDTIRAAIRGNVLTALQEMHDQQPTLKALENVGLGVWRGNREDSEASPVVWDPELFTVRNMLSLPLLPGGRRAGKHNMAKTLNIVVGRHHASGRRVAFGSLHNIQTQFLPGRREAARDFVRQAVLRATGFRCLTIIGGDWNAKPGDRSLQPVRNNPDWHNTQARDPLPTHGRRAIDGFVWSDRDRGEDIARFVDHDTIHVPGTDHKGYRARFALRTKD